MLSVFEKRFSTWGTLIWSVVGILVGATVGLGLGYSGKMLAFLIVLGLGVVWLTSIEIHTFTRLIKPLKFVINPAQPTIKPQANVQQDKVEPVIPTKKEGLQMLSREEAREWLDAFLVKQQGD